ncbi:beta-ketoacyl synthase N-terminal-like domain-containing protein [Streptomyces griseoviridis]|uniref:type I polyketide synthase n=1 Tax=Streptomyces griseoviridis TaxID=45398 RepID=UPI0033E83245
MATPAATVGPAARPEPVAVVGMEVLLPGAPDLATYWQNIVSGADAISEVPADRWDPLFYRPADPSGPPPDRRSDRFYCRRGGFVDGAEFDPTRFGIMPNSVPATEPDQLIALDVAHRSLADAGGESVLPDRRERAGIVLGRGGYLTPGLVRLDQRVRTANQLVHTLRELAPQLDEAQLEAVRAGFCDRLGPEEPESAIGLVPNLVASRVANRLDLRGPAYTVDAACASSLVAVDHAVRELTSRRCDVMLAGGVHHCHDLTLWSVFTQLGALSPSERIRPLHRDADGVLIGEGTGVVVLKRLADAQRDGDRVYAVIRGTGVAGDGRTASLFNPDPGGQIRAVRQAWEAAGLDPRAADALQLLEAHGTATAAGDRAELTTVAEVFGPATGHRAVIGSVKSQIGHTMPAAGVAGLIKAALALHHGTLPPTLHCDDPNPALEATRFTTLSAARPWDEIAGGAPRRAAVNAFGFGGINAHVVLEQPAAAPARRPRVSVGEPERVLRLAAATPGELAALLDADDGAVLAASLPETGAPGAGPVRLGIVDPTARRLGLARKAVAKGEPWRGRSDVWFTPRPVLGPAGGRTAFVFPGLEAEFTPRVDELAARLGLEWSHGPAAEVGDVGRHGAAVFQLGRLLDTALRRLDVRPDAVAGHSVGEWTAMAAAGVHAPEEVDAFLAGFDPDALRVPGVAFAVVGTAADRVLRRLDGRADVVLSHDNSPGQSMICGPEDAVAELVDGFRAEGVIAQVLPFRSGFHTPMLAPYLGPIRDAAERYGLHPPHTPVWSATVAAPFPADPDAVRELFVRHLLEPVRFRALVLEMYRAGFRAFLTLGAGQLGSLIDDTLAGRDRLVVPAHVGSRDSLAQLRRVATALWTEGAEPDVGPLDPPAAKASSGTRRTRATGRAPVRLDLGGALVSLPAADHGLLAPRRTLATAGGRTTGAEPVAVPSADRAGWATASGPDRGGRHARAVPAAGHSVRAVPAGDHAPRAVPMGDHAARAVPAADHAPRTVPTAARTGAAVPSADRAPGAARPAVPVARTDVRADVRVEPRDRPGTSAPVGTLNAGGTGGTGGAGGAGGIVSARDARGTAGSTGTLSTGGVVDSASVGGTGGTSGSAGTLSAGGAGGAGGAAGAGGTGGTGGTVSTGSARDARDARATVSTGGTLRTSDTDGTPSTSQAGGPIGRLGLAGGRGSVAAEFSALLTDTAAVAEELLAAIRAHPAPRASAPRPAVAAPRRAPAGTAGPDRPLGGDGLAPVPDVLRVDVERMPYLLDHCFFRQRPGWPDEADRWPIVPATTVIDHLTRIAEQALPGRRTVAVHQVRLQRWIEAMPASDVPVAVRRLGADRVEVTLTGHAGAVVQLAPETASAPPPALWPVDPAAERTPGLTAEQLYSERWMFHGPAFQGVTELTAIGDHHVRGVLTAPGPPGALLDNVGQLLGYWIMSSLTERTTVFPVGMARIDYFGPEPAAGTALDCHIRVREVTPTTLTADMQLVHAGRVWAQCTGWTDRRFDTDPGIRLVDRFPGRHTLSEARAEGWSVVHERWPDLATRDLIMRNMLGGAERERHAALPPTRRRRHLLGRIAAKDAVRRLLWAEGADEVYPAEIALHNDDSGRPVVTGVHGRDLGEGLTVSLAHCAEAAVALARRGPCGIDLEEVTARPAGTVDAACGPEERALLARTVAAGDESEALWFTRFWAAKEAVAKERGTGLGGRPGDFRVTTARQDLLRVEHAGSAWEVRCGQVAAPAGLPERMYVVAWTTGGAEPVSQESRHDH